MVQNAFIVAVTGKRLIVGLLCSGILLSVYAACPKVLFVRTIF